MATHILTRFSSSGWQGSSSSRRAAGTSAREPGVDIDALVEADDDLAAAIVERRAARRLAAPAPPGSSRETLQAAQDAGAVQALVVEAHLAGVIALLVDIVGQPHLLAVEIAQAEEAGRAGRSDPRRRTPGLAGLATSTSSTSFETGFDAPPRPSRPPSRKPPVDMSGCGRGPGSFDVRVAGAGIGSRPGRE